MNKIQEEIKKAEGVIGKTGGTIEERVEQNRRIFRRHHFLFGFLGTIGISSVIAGFEALALKVQILNDFHTF